MLILIMIDLHGYDQLLSYKCASKYMFYRRGSRFDLGAKCTVHV